MITNKEKYIGLAVLALILTAGISTAFADDSTNSNFQTRRAEMEQVREAHQAQMQEVFANGTYGEWVALQNQNFEDRISQMRNHHMEMMGGISEENFGQFAEAHLLMQAGDFEGAKAIFDELGIERGPFMNGHGQGMIRGMGEGRGQGFGGRKGTVDNS